MKIDKIWKPILHVALAVGITWIVILFTAIFGAAALSSAEDGSKGIGAILMFGLYHLVFFGVLLWVRHFQNDELENEFIRKYRETPYPGMKGDMTAAITTDIVVYLMVYVSLGLSMILVLSGTATEICFALLPINCLILLLHPILGFVIHLILFTAAYTYAICRIRKRWAGGSFGTGSSGVVSQQHINAMRWTRQNRR
ncbi:MAG: hypothetical protein J6N32_00415 [Clostridia bacterium]|nr:hypothetical protein [Clostridia bacterium]MBO5128407.1 hypothetical protein [Clostridia bacterium]MBP3292193.1 hypothetical protein [Clostridia bacterium]MBQ7313424.1 hypothetical protein [Clostridia bacterium]